MISLLWENSGALNSPSVLPATGQQNFAIPSALSYGCLFRTSTEVKATYSLHKMRLLSTCLLASSSGALWFPLQPKSMPAPSFPSKLTVTNILPLVLWIYISIRFLDRHISLCCKWIRPHDHEAFVAQFWAKRDVAEKCLRSSALTWLLRQSLRDK